MMQTDAKQESQRKKGTGNIRRFSNGTWQSSFSYQGRRFFLGAKSRAEAENKLDAALAYTAAHSFDGTSESLHRHLIQSGYPSGSKRVNEPVISSFNINRNTETSWRLAISIQGKRYRIGAMSEAEAQAKLLALQETAQDDTIEFSEEAIDALLKAAGFPAGRRSNAKKEQKPKHEPFKNGVRLRSEGYYEARYFYNKKSESIYATTKKEAVKKLRAIVTSIDDGSFIGKNNETLSGYLMWWLKFAGKTTLRPSTQSKYRVYIADHFIPFFGNEKLQSITTESIQKFFDYKKTAGRGDGKEGGMAHKTLTDMKNMLSKALNYAVNPKKLIPSNPASAVIMKFRRPKSIPIMATEQMERLIQSAMNSDDPIGWSIVILLRTGMRRGELLGLKLSKILSDSRYIQIDLSLSRMRHPNKEQAFEYERVDTWAKKSNKTGLYLGPPKTNSSVRGFPVGREVTECIRKLIEYQERLLGHSIAKCPNGGADNFLLVTPFIRPYDPKTYEEGFKRFLVQAGITGISVHSTRHSFTTDMLSKFPEELPSISEIVGHADKSTTLRYTHGAQNKKKALMDSF